MHFGYVIHSRRYKDNSLIVDFFTKDYGRLSLIFRGGKSGKKGFSNILQPFAPLYIDFSGKGELKTLKSVEPGGISVLPLGKRAYCGFYINELIMRLTEKEDHNFDLFSLYEMTVKLLQSGDLDFILRNFEKKLLDFLGFGLVLDYEFESGEEIDRLKSYEYIIESGPVFLRSIDNRNGKIIVSGKCLNALSSMTLVDKDIKREAKIFLRQVIDFYLGGKPLKSRELFRKAD